MNKVLQPQFIEFQGKEILRISYPGGIREDIIIRLLNEAMSIILQSKELSLLTLTVFGDFDITPALILHFKEYNHKIKPYIKAGAIVGLDGLKKTIFTALDAGAKSRLEIFTDEESAIKYLAEI